ncbi:MAG: C69 family dipeptidase [Bacteroidota bacterium]
MKIKIINILLKITVIHILVLTSFPVLSQVDTPEEESFMLLAGNKITADGSVVVAHNKGLKGDEASFLHKQPRQQHDSTEVIRLQNGLEISQTNISMAWLSLQTKNGLLQGDAVAINENQVSIAGTVSLEADRNMNARKADPLVSGGVTGRMYYIALERAETAKECVNLIGEYYNKYGIAQAKGIAVADQKEVWYMESGGGHHWAAVKIPEDAVWPQANEYRIGHIDPDNEDVIASPGLLEFARDNDLWNPDEQLFDFADAFGQKLREMDDKEQFNNLKIWRAMHLLDSTLSITPGQKEYPQFVRPDEKVDLPRIISILRDHSANASLDTLQNDSLANAIPPIASRNIVHTGMVQLTRGLPSSIGAVLWSGFSSPVTTPYIPFYFGINNPPQPYNDKTPEAQKAFQVYRALADRYHKNPEKFGEKFPHVWTEFQTKCFTEQVHIDRGAIRVHRINSPMARQFITTNVDELSQDALDIARETLEEIR